MDSTYSERSAIDRDDGDINGECVVCGKYKSRIDRGTMNPCYMWKRAKEEDSEEISSDAE